MKITNKSKYTNGKFQLLSKAEKRVEVAKDVLLQIKNWNIIASPGMWIEFSDFFRGYEDNESIKNIILKDSNKMSSCKCCGLGALMLSCTLFNNKVTVNDYREKNAFRLGEKKYYPKIKTGGLESIFTLDQRMLIELTFEGGLGMYRNDNYDMNCHPKYNNCIRFYNTYPNDTERLQAIMKNIIKHKGTFKPEVLK